MTYMEFIIGVENNIAKANCNKLNIGEYEEKQKQIYKQIRADAIDEVRRAMYHQCFECNNDEDMQKWDSGNWFRYKLFENVIEQLEEQNDNERDKDK